ncbi:flagellar biosynthetic protein FlhB [Sulfitobacter marinus]|uniref:Flagellar biosynthetic protein FlhB n=1 Tax=Sulfitobacter marinus TaxID=394264 RepID=A0A1I6TEG6_9RHOB|nr:flagellar type III secretion system protein FlhB [Sulfitobacter marinus]SFS87576.1 flagellar biosynthetic protein FlhB [Sulfitobacter marinus]
MSDQDDDQEKSFDATAEKLAEARRKGDVPKSTDLFTAAAYAGLFISISFIGQNSVDHLATALVSLQKQAPDLIQIFFEGSAFSISGGLLAIIFLAMLPIFGLPAVFVVTAIFAQKALVFAPSKLVPKLSRISIISNAKNKFGRNGLFEFGKSFLKLCIYSTCLAAFFTFRMAEIIAVLRTDHQTAIALMVKLSLDFLLIAVLVSAGIGAVDAIWQHFEHLRKNRMSRKEIQDEQKSSEGDPHLKQERRQRAMLISQSQMMADIPTADVVIVNPTHYAIALTWSRLPGEAPVCVAKGVDEIAKAIRLAATDANVPLHSDPPTARALYATTDIGDIITPDHFPAVAAAIRFAEAMRRQARGRV